VSVQVVKAFLVGQQLFSTVTDAQKAELATLFKPWNLVPGEDGAEVAAGRVVEHAAEVIAILTCAPSPKKPRSDKGKKRAAKEPVEAT
jgi:hypothetical protein